MGQNLTRPSPDDYDVNDFSHWSLEDLEKMNARFHQQNANYAHDKETLKKLLKSQFPDLKQSTIDQIWVTFDSGNELVYISEVLAGLTTKAIGPLCDKVKIVYRIFDYNKANEISFDESIVLMVTALSGITKVEKMGYPPEDAKMERLLAHYWQTKRIFDYQERMFSEADFQRMIMEMIRDCWMAGFGPCKYSDTGSSHGFVNMGEMRYKQTWVPDADTSGLWETGGKEASGAFEYYYKHNEYYLHGIEEPLDPDDKLEVGHLLETFGVLAPPAVTGEAVPAPAPAPQAVPATASEEVEEQKE